MIRTRRIKCVLNFPNKRIVADLNQLRLESAVKNGQDVERGDIIGYMGNSGRSTGYHLHYGIKKNRKHVNPFPYMMDWDKDNFILAEAEKEQERSDNQNSIASGDDNEKGKEKSGHN